MNFIIASEVFNYRLIFQHHLERLGYYHIAHAANSDDLLKEVNKLEPNFMLVDIDSPTKISLETIINIKSQFPMVKIIAITSSTFSAYIYTLKKIGIDGCVLLGSNFLYLEAAINYALKGRFFIEPFFNENFKEIDGNKTGTSKILSDNNLNPPIKKKEDFISSNLNQNEITDRERIILECLASGKTVKEISEVVFRSLRSIEDTIAKMKEKTDSKNTNQLIIVAVKNGWITI